MGRHASVASATSIRRNAAPPTTTAPSDRIHGRPSVATGAARTTASHTENTTIGTTHTTTSTTRYARSGRGGPGRPRREEVMRRRVFNPHAHLTARETA